jgi:hypothetical protein
VGARVGGRTVALVPPGGAVVILVGVLWLTNRGLEILDEGYLLRLIADPQATRPAGDVYLFGFLLHPLYEAVGQDIAVFRVVGFLVVAAGAALLTREAVALLRTREVSVTQGQQAAAALVAAASTALLLSFNVMVPAYRTTALLGSMAAAAGMARVVHDRRVTGGALLGAGLWLCFVGKPTSAAALAVVVLALAVGTRLLSRVAVAAVVASGLVSAAATLLVARMTPADAVGYLSRGAHGADVLGSHPRLAVLLGWGDPGLAALLVFAPFFVVPLVVGLLLRRWTSPGRRGAVELGILAALVVSAVVAGVLATRAMGPLGTGWQLLSLGLVLPATVVVLLVRERFEAAARRPNAELAWIGLLLVLPYVDAVGTNLPFGPAMGLASVFWVVALVVVTLGRTGPGADRGHLDWALALCVALVAVVTWVVHHNGADGGDLSRDLRSAPVEGGRLLLRPQDAAIAVLLRGAATDNRIDERTPVVDLSGMGAGYALMTAGRPLGRAHMYGYLPHSVDAARVALAAETCPDRSSAWLLYSPGNTSDISPAFTGGVLDLARDYDVMVSFEFVRDGERWPMQLLRPRSSVAVKLGC